MKKSGLRALLLAMGVLPVCAQASSMLADADFTSLSLEELVNLEISSVSRKAEPLASAAASVFVITAEDIRRHGLTTLPEALRLAPNLQVARSGAGVWSIGARGLNNTAGNKLLVLIDGRPIYSPLHSGVFWDTHDVHMPDIERIEVISGPNATTWGSNAVNGVINVVTRNAAATTGGNIMLSAGDAAQVYQARIGDTTDGDVHYRVYGKYIDADATETAAGASRNDNFTRALTGFRIDFGGDRNRYTVQGDAYEGEVDSTSSILEVSGANLLTHWQRELGTDAALDVTAYYDRSTRRTLADGLEESLDIYGLSATHRVQLTGRNALSWGTDIRYAHDNINEVPSAAFIPAHRDLSWISLFVHDEIQLRDDLSLALGARAEENDYTGVEFMPNLRVAWQLAPDHTLWTSLSRAVRTPSRLERDVYIPAEPPYLLEGGADFESEIANVIELGYRGRPAETFSWSMTAFHHDYDNLRTIETDADGVLFFDNNLRGITTGLEGWWSWQPVDAWRLDGGFFLFDKDLALRPGSTGIAETEGNDAELQWQLRSSWDMTEGTTFDLFVRHVGELPEPEVPSYTVADARIAWRVLDNLELALKVNNLLDDEHAEVGPAGSRAEFGRQAYAQLQWRYP